MGVIAFRTLYATEFLPVAVFQQNDSEFVVPRTDPFEDVEGASVAMETDDVGEAWWLVCMGGGRPCVMWVVRWSGVHFRGYLLEVCFPVLLGGLLLMGLQAVGVSA